jgi:molybdenum cofactor cytidylyltransferase
MELARALRLDASSPLHRTISLVGAGGKTTALFKLARQLIGSSTPTVYVTATSHLGTWQTSNADRHIIAKDFHSIDNLFENDLRGVTLITGEIKEDRFSPIDSKTLNWLHAKSIKLNIPILIEADGSRSHALKAPDSHEPPIPEITDTVIVLAGMSALGKPISDEYIHRAQLFSQLCGLPTHSTVTPEAIMRVLAHSNGSLKNIPPTAQRIAILNQAETQELKSIGGNMAKELINSFDSVVVGSLQQDDFHTIEKTAGIILAAGESTRFGMPKQLLEWHGKPFVRHIVETAFRASLSPVIVVSGSHAPEIESVLTGLPVTILHNPDYKQGQSTSIKTGINSLAKNIGSAVFLLADQPQIPEEVIQSLIESHTRELPPILAPLVLEERRANPVLFDRVTFADLMLLTGDSGGRSIFSKYKVEYIPWHDDRLLLDVDTPEDYQRLVEDETL